MFDARAAAKNRALKALDTVQELTQRLDRQRKELHAARESGNISTESAIALEGLIKVDQLRLVQATHVARLLEDVAAGREVLT